jgi:hypothetical protein
MKGNETYKTKNAAAKISLYKRTPPQQKIYFQQDITGKTVNGKHF